MTAHLIWSSRQSEIIYHTEIHLVILDVTAFESNKHDYVCCLLQELTGENFDRLANRGILLFQLRNVFSSCLVRQDRPLCN